MLNRKGETLMLNRVCKTLCGMSVLGALCLVTPVQAQVVISGPIVNPSNNHTYYLLEPATWTASEAKAITLGGHLATVRNLAENNWIYSQFSMFNYAGKTARGLWIGLNDAATENTFVWSSGEAVCYTNWGAGEPANQDGFDDYIHLLWPGDPRQSRWNDLQNVNNFAGIPVSGVVEVGVVTSALTISPPSGAYVTTQGFDLALIVEAGCLSVLGGSATLDGSDVTAALVSCVIPGTLVSGGQTFRCPGLTGGTFGTGTHTFSVTLDLSNGPSVSDTITWEVKENTEP